MKLRKKKQPMTERDAITRVEQMPRFLDQRPDGSLLFLTLGSISVQDEGYHCCYTHTGLEPYPQYYAEGATLLEAAKNSYAILKSEGLA